MRFVGPGGRPRVGFAVGTGEGSLSAPMAAAADSSAAFSAAAAASAARSSCVGPV